MYAFTMVVLLGLAVLVVAKIGTRQICGRYPVPGWPRWWHSE